MKQTLSSKIIEALMRMDQANIGVQSVDVCLSKFESLKRFNKITIETEHKNVDCEKFGFISWFDRPSFEDFINKSNSEAKQVGLTDILQEFKGSVEIDALRGNITSIRQLKNFTRLVLETKEGLNQSTFRMERFGMIIWCDFKQIMLEMDKIDLEEMQNIAKTLAN